MTVHDGAFSARTKVAVAVGSGICAGVGSLASGPGNLDGLISSSSPGNLDGPLSSSRVQGFDQAPVFNDCRRFNNNLNSPRVGGMLRLTDRASVATGSA